jgi:hypothetical protein
VFFAALILPPLFVSVAVTSGVYYGKVIGIELSTIQVKGENNKIATFWLGHRSHFDSKPPIFGNRVKVDCVNDRFGRNAVTMIRLLKRESPLSFFPFFL